MRGENRKKVLEFIRLKYPAAVTSAQIARRTGVSQPQIYQITRSLMEGGMVRGARKGRAWTFTWNKEARPATRAGGNGGGAPEPAGNALARFAAGACAQLEAREGAAFSATPARGAANVFVLASDDAGAAGFALHFTAPPNGRVPYARLAFINGHLWLLERMEAERLVLVLGGDEPSARVWAEDFSGLCVDVEVFFLDGDGALTPLT